MQWSRRAVLGALTPAVLGAGALSACTRRGRSRQTTPPPTTSAPKVPTSPFILATIGSTYGVPGYFSDRILKAIHESVIEVDVRGGVFGKDVEEIEPVIDAGPEDDIVAKAQEVVDSGATVVISFLEDGRLIEALPTFVDNGVVVLCPWSSSLAVRAEDVQDKGLLFRLAPTDAGIAQGYVEIAGEATKEDGLTPGAVYFVSADTTQGRSLFAELDTQLKPKGGSIVGEPLFYADGNLGDMAKLAKTIAETNPALVVLNGGPECGPLASAIYQATLDKDGRPTREIPIRLSPEASIDYSGAKLPAQSLTTTEGFDPGDVTDMEFENLMLGADPNLLDTGFSYMQQAYDAVMIAALSAEQVLSLSGPDIAQGIPKILHGSDACTDYGDCLKRLRDARSLGNAGSIAYPPMMGQFDLDGLGDLRTWSERSISYSESNERIVSDQAASRELAG